MTDDPWSERVDHIRHDTSAGKSFAIDALNESSWCHVYPELPYSDAWEVFGSTGRITRRVRGRKMRDWDGFLDEFAAAWQFGEYFGENLNAFDECMRDLNGFWPTTSGFVVVIADAEQFLAEMPDGLSDVVESFELIAHDLAVPQEMADDDPMKQPPLGFDVVLVAPPEHRDAVLRTWRAAGAPL